MAELICIMCPKGCRLNVDEKNGYAVTGNTCEKGAIYGKTELVDPRRVVTSTVKINSTHARRLPVKTNGEIPKNTVEKAVELLNGVTITAPVKAGDVIIENIFGTGIDFISAKTVED